MLACAGSVAEVLQANPPEIAKPVGRVSPDPCFGAAAQFVAQLQALGKELGGLLGFSLIAADRQQGHGGIDDARLGCPTLGLLGRAIAVVRERLGIVLVGFFSLADSFFEIAEKIEKVRNLAFGSIVIRIVLRLLASELQTFFIMF